MITEALISRDRGCSMEGHRHKTVRDGTWTWPWRCHSYEQLTVKERQTGTWARLVLGVIKRTKK